MRRTGIREARQNLSALIAEVQQGHEIVITDRGRAVARLVPPAAGIGRRLPDLAAFRRRMPVVNPPVSQAIIEERDEEI